jgi:hypothetical protein
MYQDMKDNASYFDMSEYDGDHPLFGKWLDNSNKKVLGKFKDEYHNSVITHLVCPRPKMYGIRSVKIATNEKTRGPLEPIIFLKGEDGKFTFESLESKKAKGISRTAVRNQVVLADYVNVLEDSVKTYATMKGIRSTNHIIFTEKIVKKALNGIDSKRFGVDCINTLAFGHKDIPLYE